MGPNKLQPALLGGAVLGVLSALPFINIANCCCIWFITGGVLAAYLMQQNYPAPVSAGDGAMVGLLAGVFGAIVATIVSIPLRLIAGPMQSALISRALEHAENMPPEARTWLETMSHGGAGVVFLLMGFLFHLVLGGIFATLGGLLGAMMFRKDAPFGAADESADHTAAVAAGDLVRLRSAVSGLLEGLQPVAGSP